MSTRSSSIVNFTYHTQATHSSYSVVECHIRTHSKSHDEGVQRCRPRRAAMLRHLLCTHGTGLHRCSRSVRLALRWQTGLPSWRDWW